MRKEFANTIEKIAKNDSLIIFLTGDLGFMALEGVRSVMGERFINVGVSEQNMISLAAGLAFRGLIPVCYSIAPFAVFRPAEQLRLDVGLHSMNVKIVGNGGGYGYGIMGATHHAIEDLAVVSSFPNFHCIIPCCNEDVEGAIFAMFKINGPSYLRLGFGIYPSSHDLPGFAPIRRLVAGEQVTIVALGPLAVNCLKALENIDDASIADLFVVCEIPLIELPDDLISSIQRTKKLLLIEEHVVRGGLGEHVALFLLQRQIQCQIIHRFAVGYPDGLYGSQAYHQKLSSLDAESIKNDIRILLNETI